jgi:hypothetical protein
MLNPKVRASSKSKVRAIVKTGAQELLEFTNHSKIQPFVKWGWNPFYREDRGHFCWNVIITAHVGRTAHWPVYIVTLAY